MIDVFSTLILNIVVYRYSNGVFLVCLDLVQQIQPLFCRQEAPKQCMINQLNLVENAYQSAWTESFNSCDDPTYWHQIFNDCQPESCNASSVADKVISKPQVGMKQFWIYGYVLRSPAIVNIGCFSMNTSLKNNLHNKTFSLQQNSAFECSRACPEDGVDYLFLRESECLCVSRQEFRNPLLREENTGACKIDCVNNTGNLCGGASPVDGEELYSVYEVILRKKSQKKIGDTCAIVYLNSNKLPAFQYTTCTSNWMYICEKYTKNDTYTSSGIYKDECPNKTASWYTAKQNCQKKDLKLRSYNTKFNSRCMLDKQIYWIGNHIAEKIVWAKGSLPDDALCLKLVVNNASYRFDTDNCSLHLHTLCYKQSYMTSEKNDVAFKTTVPSQVKVSTEKQHHVSSEKNYEAYITTASTKIKILTDMKQHLSSKNSDEAYVTTVSTQVKISTVTTIAGSVGGFVAIGIVAIIVIIVIRRKKSNQKDVNTAVDQGEPGTYSEPIKNTVPEERRKLVVENTIPEENLKLVNVTEEGIYNHLGDSEKMIEMKPQDSSIYDVTGDDGYHVFTGNGKQTTKDDDDLYDHGAASDVYNTLNDTVIPNRPESDTYNVINAK